MGVPTDLPPLPACQNQACNCQEIFPLPPSPRSEGSFLLEEYVMRREKEAVVGTVWMSWGNWRYNGTGRRWQEVLSLFWKGIFLIILKKASIGLELLNCLWILDNVSYTKSPSNCAQALKGLQADLDSHSGMFKKKVCHLPCH